MEITKRGDVRIPRNHSVTLAPRVCFFSKLTKRLLVSQRTATISLNVDAGLWNLLTFLSVVSELCISMRERPSAAQVIYILLQDLLTQRISWQKQNNHFNNRRTDVFFRRELQLIFEVCWVTCQPKIESACPFSPLTDSVISSVAVRIICMCVTYSREQWTDDSRKCSAADFMWRLFMPWYDVSES